MVLAPQVPTNANNAPAKESVTRLAATDDSLFADATTGITGGIMDEETKAKYDEKADLAGAGKFCTVPPPPPSPSLSVPFPEHFDELFLPRQSTFMCGTLKSARVPCTALVGIGLT